LATTQTSSGTNIIRLWPAIAKVPTALESFTTRPGSRHTRISQIEIGLIELGLRLP
jgi:hypothetical protein